MFNISTGFQEKVLSVANIFNPDIGTEMHGSSLAMREIQLNASLKYFEKSPFFGNGLAYSKMIVSSGTDSELYNMESFAFTLLMDYGSFGIICFAAFFCVLAINYARPTNTSSTKLGISLALTLAYIFFILATGFVDTFQSFMYVYITLQIANLVNNQNTNEWHEINVRPQRAQKGLG